MQRSGMSEGLLRRRILPIDNSVVVRFFALAQKGKERFSLACMATFTSPATGASLK